MNAPQAILKRRSVRHVALFAMREGGRSHSLGHFQIRLPVGSMQRQISTVLCWLDLRVVLEALLHSNLRRAQVMTRLGFSVQSARSRASNYVYRSRQRHRPAPCECMRAGNISLLEYRLHVLGQGRARQHLVRVVQTKRAVMDPSQERPRTSLNP